jgi:putative oxidoreductase
MDAAVPYLKLVGRVVLSLMFIQSGVSKIFGYAGTEAMMEQHGLSGMLLPLVILVEAGGGLCVLLGFLRPMRRSRSPASACWRRISSTTSPTT